VQSAPPQILQPHVPRFIAEEWLPTILSLWSVGWFKCHVIARPFG
jgi:hypothetical protein